MKKLIILLIAVTSTFATFAQKGKSKMSQSQTDKTVKIKYTCPMHTDVISDKAGKCSKCGMALVAKKVTNVATKSYTCPMHPDVTSDKPGKCSKCGMDLVKSKKEQKKIEVMKTYTCPMHPDVTGDKPGKCSKCGMDLVEKKTLIKSN